METREDVKGLKVTVDVIAKDQAALGVGMGGRGDVAGKVRATTGRGERARACENDIVGTVRVAQPRGGRRAREVA